MDQKSRIFPKRSSPAGLAGLLHLHGIVLCWIALDISSAQQKKLISSQYKGQENILSNFNDFSLAIATELYNSSEEFPVDFDLAWPWLGYSRKDNAKQALLDAGFIEGAEFLINQELEAPTVTGWVNPNPKEKIFLTIDCLKHWAMMAGTEKGKLVRRYFIEVEKEYKKLKNEPKHERKLRSVPKPKTIKQTVSDAKAFLSLFSHVPQDRKNIVAANWVAERHPDIADLAPRLIEAQPEQSPKEQSFTPTEIGERLKEKLSARKTNEKLESLGYQESYRTANDVKKWRATEKGEPHAVLELASKADGKPIEQLRWKASIIEELELLIAK